MDYMRLLDITLKVLGAGGVAVAIITFLSKLLAQHFLQKNLEAYKADLKTTAEQQLEAYKSDLRAKTDRELDEARQRLAAAIGKISKLHEKEFEVISDTWQKLADAVMYMIGFTARTQSYVDVDQMDELHFRDFLQQCPLSAADKNQLVATNKRSEFYAKAKFFVDLAAARNKISDLHSSVARSGIFFEPNVRVRLVELEKECWDGLTFREMAQRSQGEQSGKLWDKSVEAADRALTLMNEIERIVQIRLGYDLPPNGQFSATHR